jgi:hypothetical protein
MGWQKEERKQEREPVRRGEKIGREAEGRIEGVTLS